jgi:aminoglycoside 3-N-acetyltransferase
VIVAEPMRALSRRRGFLEALSGLAVAHLSRERIVMLRSHYHALRARMTGVLKVVNGTFAASDLRRHLDERAADDFEILMVHSSLNHMLPMFSENPLDLLAMLLEFCGRHRTLAMPAFYFGDPRLGGVVESYQQNPVFDVRRTPSQMGVVTELFRRSKGVRQSLHPTHRVAALGPLAARLTTGHDTADTACGRGTPFEFMASRDTLILGIGKPIEVLTQVHHVEDLLGDAFPVPGEYRTVLVTLRDERGQERPYTLRVRTFQRRRDMWKLPRIMTPGHLREWTFHGVPLFAARATHVTEDLLAAARRGMTLFRD